MSAEIPRTVNATIPQIEDALRAGRAVHEIADEFHEPRATIYAVQRGLAVGPPDPRTLATVAEIVAAGQASSLQRARTLADRLEVLVADLRARLTEEYDRERVAAEVAMLERRLNEAKSKLRRPPRTTSGTGHSAEKMATVRAAARGNFACPCGRTSPTKAGLAAHQRHCEAAA